MSVLLTVYSGTPSLNWVSWEDGEGTVGLSMVSEVKKAEVGRVQVSSIGASQPGSCPEALLQWVWNKQSLLQSGPGFSWAGMFRDRVILSCEK